LHLLLSGLRGTEQGLTGFFFIPNLFPLLFFSPANLGEGPACSPRCMFASDFPPDDSFSLPGDGVNLFFSSFQKGPPFFFGRKNLGLLRSSFSVWLRSPFCLGRFFLFFSFRLLQDNPPAKHLTVHTVGSLFC